MATIILFFVILLICVLVRLVITFSSDYWSYFIFGIVFISALLTWGLQILFKMY